MTHPVYLPENGNEHLIFIAPDRTRMVDTLNQLSAEGWSLCGPVTASRELAADGKPAFMATLERWKGLRTAAKAAAAAIHPGPEDPDGPGDLLREVCVMADTVSRLAMDAGHEVALTTAAAWCERIAANAREFTD